MSKWGISDTVIVRAGDKIPKSVLDGKEETKGSGVEVLKAIWQGFGENNLYEWLEKDKKQK